MSMLSKISVKRPVSIIMAILIVVILGLISLNNLTTELLPNINFPYAVITTNYFGASPELIENTVTRPIESSMSTVNNIKNISSISNENFSVVILEFDDKTNIDSVSIEIREKLDMLTSVFPDNVSNPNIMKLNPNMFPVMQFSISFEGLDIVETNEIIKNEISSKIQSVSGVANVNILGDIEESIYVSLNDEKIEQVNNKYEKIFANLNLAYQPFTITDKMIKGLVSGQNISSPIGFITENDQNMLVRIGESINSLDELKQLPVISNEVMEVVIEDVADVLLINNEAEVYSKVNGQPAIILSIQKQNNFPTSDVVKNIKNRLDTIKVEYDNIEIITILDQSEYINLTLNSVLKNLIYGALLAIIVLIFFLKDIKPTIIIGLAIPISVITTFILIYFYGITLNIISLGGLALGIGMLVDNSIVVIENIFRLRSKGINIKEAAIKGAGQVAGAITASTLTTISVFIPVIFLEGMIAEIFKQMALTVSFSLLASLIVALTIVPMFSSQIFKKESIKNIKLLQKINFIYEKILLPSLKFKYITIAITIIIFIGSILGLTKLGSEYIPTDEESNIMVDIEMPLKSSFNDTKEALDLLMDTILKIDGIEMVAITLSNNSVNIMAMDNYIYVMKDETSNRSSIDIKEEILTKTKDFPFEVFVRMESERGNLTASGIELNIKGENLDTLRMIANDLVKLLDDVKGIEKIESNIFDSPSEIQIIVDRNKSVAKGLTNFNVFSNLKDYLTPNYKATSLNIANRQIDLNVYPAKVTQITKEDIINFDIQGTKLKEIADIKTSKGFSSINRQNQSRYVTVKGSIKADHNIGLVGDIIKDRLAEFDVPNGYEIIVAGENAEINTAFNALFQALLLSILLIYMVMAIQFESLLYPFIIMFSVPLAFTGSFLALLITNTPLSVVALIGLIILSGIVVNNAIVLVDYINQLKKDGLSSVKAVVEAGKVRMRPILMTSLTTILALTVMAFKTGRGTTLIRPMAISTIGGLIFATILTLVVIPCIYVIMDNIKDKIKGGISND